MLISFAVSVPLNGYLTSLLITRGAYDARYAHDTFADTIFDYFDLFGSLCFVVLGFGWGTILPVEQGHISGRASTVRTMIAYAAQPLVGLAISSAAIIPSVLLTGRDCIYTGLHMFFVNNVHTATQDAARYIFQQRAGSFAQCSPYAITATLFFVGIVYVQTSIVCISMVRNAFQAAIYPFRYRILMSQYSWFWMIALPIGFCILFYQFFFALTLSSIFRTIEFFSLLLKGA